MNILDIIILICLVPAFIQGISKGFVEQLAALAALVVGIWAATRFADDAAVRLGTFIQAQSNVLHVIGFAIIALVAIIAFTLLGKLLSKVLKITMLGWLDKLLGIIFAIGKALVIIGILILLFDSLNTTFNFVKAETLDASILYTEIRDICNVVFPSIKSLITNA